MVPLLPGSPSGYAHSLVGRFSYGTLANVGGALRRGDSLRDLLWGALGP